MFALSIFAPLYRPMSPDSEPLKKVLKPIAYILATIAALGVIYAGISALSSHVPGHSYFLDLLKGKTGGIVAVSIGGADLLLGIGNNIRKCNKHRKILIEISDDAPNDTLHNTWRRVIAS